MMITGADKVKQKLEYLRTLSRQNNNVGVIVGYTASYALYVHEAPMKLKGQPRRGRKHKGHFWDPQGIAQSKFLEQPFREHQDELINIIHTTVKAVGIMNRAGGLDKGLMVAGLALQRMSQQRVPVEFGVLKSSAFTRLVQDNKGRG